MPNSKSDYIVAKNRVRMLKFRLDKICKNLAENKYSLTERNFRRGESGALNWAIPILEEYIKTLKVKNHEHGINVQADSRVAEG